MLFGVGSLHAQTTLTFTATSNAQHIPLDSILVLNVDQGGDTVLYAPDTVLVLDFTTSLGGGLSDSQPLGIMPPYPNPFDGSTWFQIGTMDQGHLVVSIYDMTGRTLATTERAVAPGKHAFTYHGGGQGMLLILAEINGVRSAQRMLSMSTQGVGPTLSYGGSAGFESQGTAKDAGPFTWAPGDSLKYVGYVTHAPDPLGLDSMIMGGFPSASATIPFTFGTLSDTLSEADLAILDQLSDTILPLGSILIDSTLTALDILNALDTTFIDSLGFALGPVTKSLLSATEQKRLLFARMAAYGWYLIDDSQHTYGLAGPNSPAQIGLAYGYGSKYHSRRRKPTSGQCTSDSLYALDCSGTIYRMGTEAGLTFPRGIDTTNVAFMRDTAFWRKGLEPEYDKLRVQDMGLNLPVTSMKSGDLIFWNGHNGQIFIDAPTGDKYIYQSNGTDLIADNCLDNRGPGRGPSMKPLTPATPQNTNWLTEFSGSYRIFRIKEKGCDVIVTDIDGNIYPVVQIGDQCWMAANLKTTRYNDGSTIPNVTVNTTWTQLNNGAWCNYNNIPANDATYGKLYNWYAAANPNLCPQDWHVPTDAEWQQLESALGMPVSELGLGSNRGVAENVGGKMKTTTLWSAPNTGATNESGFSGLPGGNRADSDGGFYFLISNGRWWSATQSGTSNAWLRTLRSLTAGIARDTLNQKVGLSVRCVRD